MGIQEAGMTSGTRQASLFEEATCHKHSLTEIRMRIGLNGIPLSFRAIAI